MNILIAPNAFKGSLSAEEAAACIAEGLRRSNLSCELTLFPVADGGDDTLSLLLKRTGGIPVPVPVHDPLGRPVISRMGWVAEDKKALIGVSEASGLRLLKKEELDPLHANTAGTGEMIRAALDKGAQKLVIGVGGSATVDGATGLLKALGARFFDEAGRAIGDLPAGLLKLKSIDTADLDARLRPAEITVLCDVHNSLLGSEGAAAVYGPQKGAGKEEVVLLEACLQRLSAVTREATGIDMASLPFGGAAGGVAAGLAAFMNARLVSGIGFFLDELHFDRALLKADILITAEGSIDLQTLEGKGTFGVAARAKAKGIPVIGLAGRVPAEPHKELDAYFDKLLAINPALSSLQEAMRHTALNLTRVAAELGNMLAS